MAHLSFSNAAAAGVAVVKEIQATAAHLAHLMRSVHGGHWSIDIDHETCFVSVARDFGERNENAPMGGIADMAATAANQGTVLLATLQRDVDAVAAGMEAIHGGEWRVKINHETCYVTVSRNFKPAAKPMGRAV